MAGYGSSDYTPTIQQVRDVALLGAIDAAGGEQNLDFPGFKAMLDRALNNMKAEAWDEGLAHGGRMGHEDLWDYENSPYDDNPYRKAGDDGR